MLFRKSSEIKESVATLKKGKETKGMVVNIKKGGKTKRSVAILDKGFATKNKNENTACVGKKRKHDGVLVKKYNSYQSGSSLDQVQTKNIPSLLDIPTDMSMHRFLRKPGFPYQPLSPSSRLNQTSVWEGKKMFSFFVKKTLPFSIAFSLFIDFSVFICEFSNSGYKDKVIRKLINFYKIGNS